HALQERCFTLQAPEELNDARRIGEMFAFFGLSPAQPKLVVGGRKNRSIGRGQTVISTEDRRQAAEVLERLPARYLEIFETAPYANRPWCGTLLKRAGAEERLAGSPA
ncbi:MAG TPA: hypothetical protein VLT36_19885, partial [Candidatus Dormibacteraeota bacterium]|nr:hypothetical protein [Candidatus Dormibacteraeota bacterium]